MDSEVKLQLEKAEHEFRLAYALFKLSADAKLKAEIETNPDDTFYSAVISHCYYSLFYATEAILLTKGIKTKLPDIHKKTFEEFKKNLVDTGELDAELPKIYKGLTVRADELLGLFAYEKWKRGHFTYKTVAQANIEPAKESLAGAKKFVSNIKLVIFRRPSE